MNRMLILVALILIPIGSIHARPEYAVKVKASCTACHVAPWGGGPRSVYGKIYGSHNLGMAKTSSSDLFYGDLRTIAFYPINPAQRTNGIATMEIAPSANVPIIESPEGSEFRAVATYNFAPIAPGPREAYMRWRPFAEDSGILGYVTFGRINVPFGLFTDEHRSYTKLQTNTSLNAFNQGLAISGSLYQGLQYDWALLSDMQSASFSNGGLTWATVLNLRYSPPELPFSIGISAQHQSMTTLPNPRAATVYGVFSVDSLTGGDIPLSLLGEVSVAQNWNQSKINPGLGAFFIPAAAAPFQSATQLSTSRGYQSMAKVTLSDRWTVLYKFDYLALDANFTADAFARHGLGINYFFNSNLMIDTRVEKSLVGRPEIKGSSVFGAEDCFLAMLRLWI